MATKSEWYLQPKFLFGIFTFANTLLFIDRGIVPGASNEFNSFIKDNVDTDTPDVFLGLLQSAFIVGLAIGSSVFGHMVHYNGRFFLTGLGCAIWMAAVMLSGLAKYADSYVFLVFARMLSGVGEASLQVNIPPWIQHTAPPHERGMWLAIFYTAIPVGTATGYAYSSLMAESLGWQWAYFIEGLCMAPLVFFMFSISHHFPVVDPRKLDELDEDAEIAEQIAIEKHVPYVAPLPPHPATHTHTSMHTQSSNVNSGGVSSTINGTGGAQRSVSKERGSKEHSFSEPSSQLQIVKDTNVISEDDRLRMRSTSNNSTSGAAKKLQSDAERNGGDEECNYNPNHHHHVYKHAYTPTLVEEFGIVFSKPLFLCLVAGYAAQTAMLIGLSTFGSAFMMGLGYFDTESQSSTIFGALICMSGIISTPLGGIVLDRMLAKATHRSLPQLNTDSGESSPTPSTGLTSGSNHEVINVVHSGTPPPTGGNGKGPAVSNTSGSKNSAVTDEEIFMHGHSMSRRSDAPEDSDLLKRRKMDCILQLITLSSLAGVIILCMCYWLHDRFAFLALVTVGVGILFFCTPAINMGFMLAVPTANQSFGLAMMVVFMHALGDVPSPVIVGLIKDTLAPGCVGDADDDGAAAATSDECRDDASGLRLTILLVDLWLLWCVVFFGLAWFLNHYYRKQVERLNYCAPQGLCCPCVEKRVVEDDEIDGDEDKLLTSLINS